MDNTELIEDDEVISTIREQQRTIQKAQQIQQTALRVWCSQNDVQMGEVEDYKFTPDGDISLLMENDE